MNILAADIGGTNARFALFRVEGRGADLSLRMTAEKWLSTGLYPSFAALTAGLMHPGPFYDPADPPALAVLAVPGPVENGDFCAPPNIRWAIRAGEAVLPGLSSVALLNDFEAQAHAALWGRPRPEEVDMRLVLPGAGKAGAPTAVVGAGTGLGKALIVEPGRPGEAPRVLPSEGGHAEVPFLPEDGDFPDYLRQKIGRAYLDGDAALGGSGLAHLASFHTRRSVPEKEAPAVALEHPVILARYAALYGRVCRNFVVDTLAENGLVLTGGMAARLPVTGHPAFIEAFRHCPSLPGVMDAVPVFHMRSQAAGLFGAARYGLSLLRV